MSTAGPNLPTAATGTTNTIGGGTVAWSNPTNIEANDGTVASCLPGVAVTDDLRGGGFGFSIPTGATIKGITLEVNASAFVNGIEAYHTVVLEGGGGASANRASGVLSNTLTTATFGGPTDLWGTTWTPAQINAGGFVANVTFQSTGSGPGTVSVDFFRITVTYGVDANVNVTGVSATGSLGTATFKGTATVSPTGRSATASLGTATFKGTANFNATGLSATASLGGAIPTISVPVTGVSATASLGTATFKGTATFAVTGLSATASLGAVIPTVFSLPTGLSATASIGTATFKGTANFNATGLSATASLGQVRIDAVISITGVQATGLLGQIIDVLSANVVGVSASAFVRSVTVEVRNRMPVVVWIN
jgi:hypothetical protein